MPLIYVWDIQRRSRGTTRTKIDLKTHSLQSRAMTITTDSCFLSEMFSLWEVEESKDVSANASQNMEPLLEPSWQRRGYNTWPLTFLCLWNSMSIGWCIKGQLSIHGANHLKDKMTGQSDKCWKKMTWQKKKKLFTTDKIKINRNNNSKKISF